MLGCLDVFQSFEADSTKRSIFCRVQMFRLTPGIVVFWMSGAVWSRIVVFCFRRFFATSKLDRSAGPVLYRVRLTWILLSPWALGLQELRDVSSKSSFFEVLNEKKSSIFDG